MLFTVIKILKEHNPVEQLSGREFFSTGPAKAIQRARILDEGETRDNTVRFPAEGRKEGIIGSFLGNSYIKSDNTMETAVSNLTPQF